MSLGEKYERLLDQMQLVWDTSYAWHKEHGTMDEWLDYMAKAQKKMLPLSTGLGKAFFEFAKKVTPGRTFKQIINESVYDQQKWMPFSSLEASWVSDREAVLRIKNCPMIRKSEELLKKAGLNITAKYICENDQKLMRKVFEEFGVDLIGNIEENGCQFTAKLK
jgi:hypothetical protein